MRTCRRPAFLLALSAAVSISCSGDPEVLRQRYLAQGDQYLADNRPREAVLAYRNAVAQDEGRGEARLKLARAQEAAGDRRGALREAVRAADLMTGNVEAQLHAARLLLAAGQFEDAKTRASAVLELEPSNVDALILLGNAFANLKDLDGAVEVFEEAIERDPGRDATYAHLGLIQVARGDRAAAEAAYRRAVEARPDAPLARLALGNFYLSSDRRAEAEAELRKAYELAPDSAAVNRGLAIFYLTGPASRDAEPYLEKAAELSTTAGSKLVLADFYMAHGKVDHAVRVLEPLAATEDGQAPANVRLAVIDFERGRRAEAFARLDRTLAQRPNDEYVLLARGRLLFADRNYREAADVAGVMLAANPDSVEAYYLRATSLEALGSLAGARDALERAFALAPSDLIIQAKLADVSLKTGDARQALALSAPLVKARPESLPVRFLYAKALLGTGDLRGAERELTALATAEPRLAEVHTWLGMLHEARKDTRSARQAFQRALELQPDDRLAFAGLIGSDLAEQRYDAARARLDTRLLATPRDPAMLLLAGRTFSAMGDLDRAEGAYRALLNVDSHSMAAYTGLAGLYVSQNRLNEARKVFEDASRQQEKPAAAKTMIGIILTMQNNRAEARRYYQEALDIDPANGVAANNLAWEYAEAGENLLVALQLAQTAKAQLGDDPQVNDTLGWVYYRNDMFPQAVSALSDAARQSPSNARVHYRLGLAHWKAGNITEARRALQRVIELDRGFAEAERVPQLLATIQG